MSPRMSLITAVSLVGYLGPAIAGEGFVGLVIAALMLPVVIARIESEERLLSETFGAEYEAYRARTWRLVPHRLKGCLGAVHLLNVRSLRPRNGTVP